VKANQSFLLFKIEAIAKGFRPCGYSMKKEYQKRKHETI